MDKGNQELIRGFRSRFEAIKNKRLLSILERVAWDLVRKTKVPIVTHNLWDSIGCGIYYNGVLMKISFPDPIADVPRTEIYDINVPDREYWGIEELQDMIENPPVRILSHRGWSLYYVAAMPYSKIKQDEGVNVLRDELIKPIFQTHIHTLNL
jgi:hypothetical protein